MRFEKTEEPDKFSLNRERHPFAEFFGNVATLIPLHSALHTHPSLAQKLVISFCK
jgi:hypothetical protein